MTYYVSSATLNPTHTLTHVVYSSNSTVLTATGQVDGNYK